MKPPHPRQGGPPPGKRAPDGTRARPGRGVQRDRSDRHDAGERRDRGGQPGEGSRAGGPARGPDRSPADLLVGWHPVHEALLARPRQVGKILLSIGRHDGRVAELCRLAKESGIPVHRVPPEALQRLVPRGLPHQGIAAEVSPQTYREPEELLDGVQERTIFVLLDEIQDPRNVGAIARTAAAVRADGLFLPIHRSAALTAVSARAAAGGLESVPVARVTNLSRLLREMGERGLFRVGLDPRANDLYTAIPGDRPLALVLGGEEKGLRPGVRGECDLLVRIPIPGPVGSLNVSVAAGIALYEVMRARSGKGHSY